MELVRPATTASPREPRANAASVPPPPLSLPGRHFAAALACLVLGAVGLVVVATDLARGTFLMPHVAAVTHLFTLGWITLSIVGALYQFLPVAVGVAIRWRFVADATFVLFVTGLPLFVTGLWTYSPGLTHTGACGVASALLLFVVNLVASLARAKRRGVTFWALLASSTFLLATLALGLTLAINLHRPILLDRFQWLAVHIHLALVGWVLLVVVGVAHRLLPMFLLSHGASERPGAIAVALLASGAAGLAASPFTGQRLVPAVLIVAGIAAFLVQCVLFVRTRKRRELDPALRLAVFALGALAAATALAPIALWRGFGDVRLLVTYGLAAVVCALSLFVAAHYYKIIPFIIWYWRFGPRVGKEKVPTVAELYSARIARADVAALAVGAVGLTVSVAMGAPIVARVFAGLFVCGALLEAFELSRVARRGT